VNGISRIGYMKGGQSARWVDENIADSITLKALQFIENNRNKPFFLYFGTQDAHVPRVPHPRFVGKSGLGPRGDAIVQFDWSVGEVMKKLKELKLEKNTLIIVSSDNGPVLDDGYHDQAVELLGENKPWGPLRGGKYSSFEAGTRVPQIISWKSKIKPSVSNALTSHIDWYASLAALISAKTLIGECPDSRNQLNTLLGKDKKGCEYVIKQNVHLALSIIQGDWKYIDPNNAGQKSRETNIELGNSKKPQLYNLKVDIGEQNNLAEQFPEKVQELKALLDSIKSKIN
jgi:arylsulfatase A-like enzyme